MPELIAWMDLGDVGRGKISRLMRQQYLGHQRWL